MSSFSKRKRNFLRVSSKEELKILSPPTLSSRKKTNKHLIRVYKTVNGMVNGSEAVWVIGQS